jgi:hypothetical protein
VKYSFALLGIVLLALPPLKQDATNNTADSAKEADIRNLIELTGTRDIIQESANQSIEAYRERLLTESA